MGHLIEWVIEGSNRGYHPQQGFAVTEDTAFFSVGTLITGIGGTVITQRLGGRKGKNIAGSIYLIVRILEA